jgi:hypothetical protein
LLAGLSKNGANLSTREIKPWNKCTLDEFYFTDLPNWTTVDLGSGECTL